MTLQYGVPPCPLFAQLGHGADLPRTITREDQVPDHVIRLAVSHPRSPCSDSFPEETTRDAPVHTGRDITIEQQVPNREDV
jgi:hypothetical protein